jgi:spartin
MVTSTPDAHILVTIPSVTLTSSSSGTFAGQQLALEYVTFDIPESSTAATRDVLLVLRVGTGSSAAFEAPLDPARGLTVSTLPAAPAATSAPTATATVTRRYVFHATRDDAEFSVELPVTPETADDVELFHSVLVGYATDLHSDAPADAQLRQSANPEEAGSGGEEDLRGRFVLVNEDNGEIVGALDSSVRVHEDPSLGERGHEEDPVVVELPEGASALNELRDIEVLVRTVPPEDRDWMLKGAVFVRHVLLSFPLSLPLSLTKNSGNPAMPSLAPPPCSRAPWPPPRTTTSRIRRPHPPPPPPRAQARARARARLAAPRRRRRHHPRARSSSCSPQRPGNTSRASTPSAAAP